MNNTSVELDYIPFPLFIINNDSFYYANKKALEMLGYTEENFYTLKISDVTEDGKLTEPKFIYKAVEEHEYFVFESDFINADGGCLSLEISAAKSSMNNRDGDIILFAQDISRQKELEEKAEESRKMKMEFLNNVSHEIRTPMNGIIGFADLLNNPDLDFTERKKYIEIINQSSMQLINIIDNIIEIAELKKQKISPVLETTEADSILNRIYNNHKHRAQGKNLELILEKNRNNTAVRVHTDIDKAVRIMDILVDNAIKFTHEGSIRAGYTVADNSITFFVKDTGIGIDPKNKDVIFESFSQENGKYSRQYGGWGVGLSIAKRYAEIIGGILSFSSKKGKGSTFSLKLPVIQTITSDSKDHTNRNAILVVEDEGINFLYLESLLKKLIPFEVYHAKNGVEAIDTILHHENIALVLMDLKMPVMSGFEATEKIKSIKPKLPVIVQSAYSSVEDLEKAKETGCDEYLVKPINPEKLSIVLEKYLGVLK